MIRPAFIKTANELQRDMNKTIKRLEQRRLNTQLEDREGWKKAREAEDFIRVMKESTDYLLQLYVYESVDKATGEHWLRVIKMCQEAEMTDRELRVYLSLGGFYEEKYTIKTLAIIWGVTEARVRKLKVSSLKKLENYMRGKDEEEV